MIKTLMRKAQNYAAKYSDMEIVELQEKSYEMSHECNEIQKEILTAFWGCVLELKKSQH